MKDHRVGEHGGDIPAFLRGDRESHHRDTQVHQRNSERWYLSEHHGENGLFRFQSERAGEKEHICFRLQGGNNRWNDASPIMDNRRALIANRLKGARGREEVHGTVATVMDLRKIALFKGI